MELAKHAQAVEGIKVLESLSPYPNDDELGYTDDFPNKMVNLREYRGKCNIGMPATYIENLTHFVLDPVCSPTDLSYYFVDVFKINQPIE